MFRELFQWHRRATAAATHLGFDLVPLEEVQRHSVARRHGGHEAEALARPHHAVRVRLEKETDAYKVELVLVARVVHVQVDVDVGREDDRCRRDLEKI